MRYLTTGEVARACKVSLTAVHKWIASGKLQATRTPGGRGDQIHDRGWADAPGSNSLYRNFRADFFPSLTSPHHF